MSNFTFSSEDTTVSFAGLNLSSGLADDAVNIVFEEDRTSRTQGMKTSDSVFTRNPNRSATITINALFGGKADQTLTTLVEFEDETKQTISGNMSVRNKADNIDFDGVGTRLKTTTPIPYKTDAGDMMHTWVFVADIGKIAASGSVSQQVKSAIKGILSI